MESQIPPFKFIYNESTKMYECQSQGSGLFNNFYLDEIRHNSENLSEFNSLKIEDALTHTLMAETIFRQEDKKGDRTYIRDSNNEPINIKLKENTFLRFTMKGKGDKIISGITLFCGFNNKSRTINGFIFKKEISVNALNNLRICAQPTDINYLMYTSGSSDIYLLDKFRNKCYEISSGISVRDLAFGDSLVSAYEVFKTSL